MNVSMDMENGDMDVDAYPSPPSIRMDMNRYYWGQRIWISLRIYNIYQKLHCGLLKNFHMKFDAQGAKLYCGLVS